MGDEVWADVAGYPGLQASSQGVVRNLAMSGRVKRQAVRDGYYQVKAKRAGKQSRVPVHKLVLLAFAGERPFPGAVCRHLDGNPLNNSADNLAWGTNAENHQDSVRHGTAVCLRRGDAHPRTAITSTRFAEIKSLHSQGVTLKELGKRFGVTGNWVSRLLRGLSRPELANAA